MSFRYRGPDRSIDPTNIITGLALGIRSDSESSGGLALVLLIYLTGFGLFSSALFAIHRYTHSGVFAIFLTLVTLVAIFYDLSDRYFVQRLFWTFMYLLKGILKLVFFFAVGLGGLAILVTGLRWLFIGL